MAKRTEMSSLTVLKAEGSIPGQTLAGPRLLGSSQENSSLLLPVAGGAAGIPWLLPTPLQSPPPSSPCLLLCAGQISLCLLHKSIQLTVLRAHAGNQGPSCHVKILNFITYPKILYIRFPQKVTFTGSRMRTWIPFRGLLSTCHIKGQRMAFQEEYETLAKASKLQESKKGLGRTRSLKRLRCCLHFEDREATSRGSKECLQSKGFMSCSPAI